jgi:hypothetical protein
MRCFSRTDSKYTFSLALRSKKRHVTVSEQKANYRKAGLEGPEGAHHGIPGSATAGREFTGQTAS